MLARARQRNAPWTQREEAQRLPLACLAGPFIVLSLFWAGWTARRSIHWLVPVLAGVPFGIGYLLIFMALLNYLTDAYAVFAASAMAATGTTRSVFGATLPFATRLMYARLGVPWACSLLGCVMLLLCAVPFGFWVWGEQIRARSAFCNELRERQRRCEEEARARDEEEKRESAWDTELGAGLVGGVRES